MSFVAKFVYVNFMKRLGYCSDIKIIIIINPILLTSGSPFALWISLILLTSGSLFGLWMSTILLTSGSPFGLWFSLILFTSVFLYRL